MNQAQRERVVEAALSCVGVPFALGQASRAGMDCAGLLHYVASMAGLWAPELPRYTRRDCFGRKVYLAARARLDEVPATVSPDIGNVLLFWINRREVPMHLAIYVGSGGMVHAYPETRRVCLVSLQGYWSSRMFAAFEFRELTGMINHRAPERI